MNYAHLAGVSGLLAAGAMQIALAPGSEALDQADLVGTWTSIDTDGSHQWLTIRGGGGGTYAMFVYDESATSACGGAPARVTGSGRLVEDDLIMSGTLTCVPGGNVFRSRLTLDFHVDPGGTLTDFSGVVWTRS